MSMFSQGLEQDRLAVDIYLKMIARAEEELDLQKLVIRNLDDFEKLLPLKNFLPFLE